MSGVKRVRLRPALAGLAVAAMLVGLPVLLPQSSAAYKRTASDGVNQWSAAVATCSSEVLADSPLYYYKLAETSGTTVTDSSGGNRNGVYQGGGFTYNVTATPCTGKGVTFNGSTAYISTPTQLSSPNTFTLETWFRTVTSTGGILIGFATNQTGTSGQYDRQIWMRNDGKLSFGVYNGGTQVLTSPFALNDGAWHHVVATMSGAGMRLYVDKSSVGSNTNTAGEPHTGYWRVGWTNMDSGWPGNSTSAYFAGTLTQTAIYQTALSATRIAAHYDAA